MIEVLKTIPPRRQVIKDLALELLSRHRTGRLLDLSDYTLLLPGQRAGRRLLEILSELCAKEKILFLPPKAETDISFLRRLAKETAGPKLASPFETTDIWRKVLKENSALLPDIITTFAEGENVPDNVFTSLGDSLAKLKKELFLNQISLKDIIEKGELPSDEEARRYESIGKLFSAYGTKLDVYGLMDETKALKFILDSPPGEIKKIYLFACRDNIPFLLKLFQREDYDVKLLLVGDAAWFDETGLLKKDASFPPTKALLSPNTKIFPTPLEEAEEIYLSLKKETEERTLSQCDVTIASQDSGICSFLRVFAKEDLTFHEASGKLWHETEPGLFCQSLTELLLNPSAKACIEFLRLPCVERAAVAEIKTFHNLEEVLPVFTKILTERLGEHPKSWMFESHPNQDPLKLFLFLEELAKPWRQKLTKSQWLEVWKGTLTKLKASQSPEDQSAWQQTDALAETLAASRIEEEEIGGDAFLKRLEAQAKKTHVTIQTDADAIDVTGWLEVVLDDSPIIFLCDINEGILPKVKASDVFLPDKLRARLGMSCGEDIIRRDRYYLRLLLDKDAKTYLFACRQSVDGTYRTLSRLLCDESEDPVDRAKYVEEFYAKTQGGSAKLYASLFLPKFEAGSLPDPLIETIRASLSSISASNLNAFRECPFKFALWQIGVQSDSPIFREMAPNIYGTLAHHVMQKFAEAKMAGSLPSDEEKMNAFFAETLQALCGKFFGSALPPLANFQIMQLREKLALFAKEHLDWEKEGWEIIMAEQKFEKEIKGVRLTGKLDRLDRNTASQNSICVIDYKTGATAKSEKEMQEDLQLPAYLKLLEDVFPPEVERRYAFVNFSADKTQEKVYAPLALICGSGVIEETLDQILQSDFHNIFPHKNCQYCPYKTVCELSDRERITKVEEIIGCRE